MHDQLLGDISLRNPRRRVVSLSAPWGARIPSGGGSPGIYLVASGSVTLGLRGAAPVTLGTGDVALLPQGAAHTIASGLDAPLTAAGEYTATAEYVAGGGGGASAELRTLCFDIEGGPARAIMDFAPPLVVVRAQEARSWFSHIARATCDLLEAEQRAPELAERRLGELLVSEALAGRVFAPGREVDYAVVRAALLLRGDLAAKWTSAALARRVGLSRSCLYDRFVRALGCPPHAYLLRARMEQAAILLARGDGVAEVARRMGYRGPSAFSAAFRCFLGVAPSVYKHRALVAAKAFDQ